MKTAEPTDWNALPMPEVNATVPLGLLCDAEQTAVIRRGVIPREMGDKWFVYWKDDRLFFNRSWTGFGVFEVRFACEEHAAGGADAADNGLCLCTFHHKAFDRGAIALTDDCRVLVSQHVRGSYGLEEWLLRFSGTPISSPLFGEPAPSAKNLGWHRQEVFRAPERLHNGSNGQ